MAKTIDVGVFIPVGNHGWIHSVNSPAVETATFERVLEVVRGAERLGYDFVLSPGIWRGRKGPSRHWMHALESTTTSAALLALTERIKVFSTVHMTVYPPATIAKKMATLDQIAPGRVGLNLVTGSSYLDLAHVGLWNDEYDHDSRYDMADEWVQLLKKFWNDEVIDHKGKFFQTEQGHMGPKPSVQPTLVNAGSSGRGFRFAAENCDVAFMVVSDEPAFLDNAKAAKQTARETGHSDLKTMGLLQLVPAETDEEAQALLEHFDAGVDLECLADIAAGYASNKDDAKTGANSRFFAEGAAPSSVMSGTMTGGYESLARRISHMVNEGELDGFMVIVPDYVKDLEGIATKLFPLMAQYGVETRLAQQSNA